MGRPTPKPTTRRRRAADPRDLAPNENVSVGFWMLAQFLLFIPLVNFLAIAVLAFVPGNQSRKNFFQALLVWLGLVVVLYAVLILIGVSPLLFLWLKEAWAAVVKALSF